MGKQSGAKRDAVRAATPKKSTPRPNRKDQAKPQMKQPRERAAGPRREVRFNEMQSTTSYNPNLPIVAARRVIRSPSAAVETLTPLKTSSKNRGSPSPAAANSTWFQVHSPAPGSPAGWFTVTTPAKGKSTATSNNNTTTSSLFSSLSVLLNKLLGY